MYLLESGMLFVVVVTLDFLRVGTLQILMDVPLVKLLEHIVLVSIQLMIYWTLLMMPLGRITTSCVSGQFRLWRPYNNTGPANEGIPLYCRSGTWRSVCSYSFNCYTAKLICKAMGYLGALGWYKNVHHFVVFHLTGTRSYGFYGQYHTSYYETRFWSCSYSRTSISQCSSLTRTCCSYNRYGSCRQYCYRCRSTTSIGLVCYSSQGMTIMCYIHYALLHYGHSIW